MELLYSLLLLSSLTYCQPAPVSPKDFAVIQENTIANSNFQTSTPHRSLSQPTSFKAKQGHLSFEELKEKWSNFKPKDKEIVKTGPHMIDVDHSLIPSNCCPCAVRKNIILTKAFCCPCSVESIKL